MGLGVGVGLGFGFRFGFGFGFGYGFGFGFGLGLGLGLGLGIRVKLRWLTTEADHHQRPAFSFSPSKSLSPLSHQLSMHGFQPSATSSIPSKPCTTRPTSDRSLLGLPGRGQA